MENTDKDLLPIVSICCITFNHEKYIRDALEGFLMQKTTFPIEIIIHDDASTDKTADIIKEYVAKSPHLFVPIYQTENQYSQGIKPIVQYVFPRARGKYIALCEGDDYWTDPYKLMKQVQVLEENEDVGLVFTSADYLIQKKDKLINSSTDCNYSTYGIFTANPIRTLTTCFSRQKLLECMQFYHENKIVFFDFPLFLWFSYFTKIHYLPIKTGVYRFSNNSVTHNRDIKKLLAFKKQCYDIRQFWQQNYLNDFSKEEMDKKYYLECYHLCLFFDSNRKYINDYKEYLLKNNTNIPFIISLSVKNSMIEIFIIKSLKMLRRVRTFILNH